MHKSVYSKLLLAYQGFLKDGILVDKSFKDLANLVGDLLFSIESLEDKDSRSLIKLQNLLDLYAEKADYILSDCKEELTSSLQYLLLELRSSIDEIYYKKNSQITPFPTRFIKVISESAPPNQTNPKSAERIVVSETIANVISLINEDMNDLIQPLFEKCKFQVALKDHCNNILYINTIGAATIGGNIQTFQGRNCYDIFSEFDKKYHEDDLKVIEQNKAMRNVEAETRLKGSNSSIFITVDKIPIRTPENKPLVLGIFRLTDN